MTNRDPLYRPRRFPAEIIAHAVWLSFRFAFAPAGDRGHAGRSWDHCLAPDDPPVGRVIWSYLRQQQASILPRCKTRVHAGCSASAPPCSTPHPMTSPRAIVANWE
ncbi:hypothetical protein IE4771_PA00148 (plasmid) [Rhizobium etli bv. mimosae str. IE4771]|uniref:Transposase n=1 Tax=Rhizobium etli bv. mimosae str. IE4771 TaxID=1432050 RepID=A0A060I7F7_RHIET|nr:probable transposase protein [Sinorhizobium fredii GR64]AIC29654.1 hypothetical protein IE4771_PA00148 [Rhizobium sp. IE4771]